MRSLTFSRPKWSSSRISSAAPRSRRVLGPLVPGKRHQRFQVGANDGRLGRDGGHPLQARQFLEQLFANVVRQAALVDPGAQRLDLVAVLAAKLVVDGVELLPEEVLALVLVDLLANPRLDLLLEQGILGLAGEVDRDLLQVA